MLYEITDGSVSLGADTVLSHINFEIHGTEKIAVVGRNGAGKTTLLRLLAGELSLDRDDKRQGPGIKAARKLTVAMHCQQPFEQTFEKDAQFSGRLEQTVEEMILSACGEEFSRERFDYEQAYDRLFTGLGFDLADKGKRLREFSGGEQTKIALIEKLLSEPDILLLDEPTNHLDMDTCLWLENYLRDYPRAVVLVSHDRFFLDRVAEVVYELENGCLTRYAGNYTASRLQKSKNLQIAQKAYLRQQEEIARLQGLIERFKHKPKKAAFARSRQKMLERMEKLPQPRMDNRHIFTGEIHPLTPGSKWVLEAKDLKTGYERPLMTIDLRIRRGQKIGIIGPNGAGKTTFLKTAAGLLLPLAGKMTVGNDVSIGYFDQHSAQITSEKTVFEYFHEQFPSLTQKETRNILGNFLFGADMAQRPVSALSGGERARLVLAVLLQSRPNFLILDEPTNHMDISAKETLESAFRAYTGTILFVSHDRYFIDQVAQSVLIFEHGEAAYYPFGYRHYIEKIQQSGDIPALRQAKEQALIEGMRAVPKAERHQLAEVSAEELYVEWKMKPLAQQMAVRYADAGKAWEDRQLRLEAFFSSERFWCGEAADVMPDADYEKAWQLWHESCLAWWDMWLELEDAH